MSFFGKACIFLLLSGVDLSLTWLLLNYEDGGVGEANPIAAYFLDTHGWMGMAIFKGCMAFTAVGICALLTLRRPAVAHRVLNLGIVVVGGVVAYSCVLTGHLGVEAARLKAMEAYNNAYVVHEITPEEFFEIHQEVAQEMVEGYHTLRTAVREVANRLEGRIWCTEVYEGKVVHEMFVNEDGPIDVDMIPVEHMANRLILEASVLLRNHTEDAPQIARRLVLDGRSYFAIEPPSSLLEIAFPEDTRTTPPSIRTRTGPEPEVFAEAL